MCGEKVTFESFSLHSILERQRVLSVGAAVSIIKGSGLASTVFYLSLSLCLAATHRLAFCDILLQGPQTHRQEAATLLLRLGVQQIKQLKLCHPHKQRCWEAVVLSTLNLFLAVTLTE